MNKLSIHPEMKRLSERIMIEMKRPIDEVLFHFISETGSDLDGFNLFTINDGGVHFKQSVRKRTDFTELDLDGENGAILKITGVDLYDS